MNRMKTLFITLMFILTSVTSVFGATFDDLNIKNFNKLPEELKYKVDYTISQIPSDVAKYHKYLGAELYFSDTDLDIYDEHLLDMKGVYYIDTSDIGIRYNYDNNSMYNLLIYNSIMHEFGHFIHYSTKSFWTDEMNQTLENEFNYWKNYVSACYNKDETFAFLYANANNTSLISKESVDLIRNVELICSALYNLELENPDLEFGPGSYKFYCDYIENYKIINSL